ncbi:MAG: NAD(P)/FAD-dependent oxidoreductase [Deltaproteobacteria bacterium]|nr:NAD(P)/FAD-dependent oxidoreductase [Deltaproteobacteria bacterium]
MVPTAICIVGAGPAGLATALALNRRGIGPVVVLESKAGARDKACGEGLMPDAVAGLERLGVDLSSTESAPLRGLRYLWAEDPLAVGAEGRFPVGEGLGMRRMELGRALIAAVKGSGIEVRYRSRVEGLSPRGLWVNGQEVETSWVIGADGLHSRVRRWAGLETSSLPRKISSGDRFGIRQHFRTPPWSDLVEVHWSCGTEAYVTPTGPREVCVTLLFSALHRPTQFATLLEEFPLLRERLEGAEPCSQELGAGLFRQRAKSVLRGQVALVGDAAGYTDALGGDGIALAVHQAEALASALDRGRPNIYEMEFRRIIRWPKAVGRLLLEATRRPWLRDRMIHALGGNPELFSRLLAVHCRALPTRQFGCRWAADLMLRLAVGGQRCPSLAIPVRMPARVAGSPSRRRPS